MRSVQRSVSKSVLKSVFSPINIPAAMSVASFDIYVDSVNGNNANSGLTPQSAKQTLAAARGLLTVDNMSLGLARGSIWKEQFDVPINGLTIGVYGTGAAPIIDGAETIPASWAQPDNITYPNVWAVSWTRAQAATTASAHLGIWVDGVIPSRYASSLSDLQSNGGYYIADLTATTTTIYIKSATNPNSNGVLYEASYRRYAINGHATALGSTKTGQIVTGPIEMKRAIEHYGAHTAGLSSTTKKLLILDGTIHHTVTEGVLTEDSLYSGVVPSVASSAAVAYTSQTPSTLQHTFRRCLALFPGGVARASNTGFYGHGTSTIGSLTVEQCITTGATLSGADALNVVTRDSYSEETLMGNITVSSTSSTFSVDRVIMRDLTQVSDVNGNTSFRRLAGTTAITINNCGFHNKKASTVRLQGTSGTRPTIRNSVLFFNGSGSGGGIDGSGAVGMSYSVVVASDTMYSSNSIVSDFNIYYRINSTFVRSIINSTLYQTLAAWQAATGQDTNSVYLNSADQTAGNPYALWLGVSSNANNGPADGDWRINPGARVYSGAGTAFIGTFADGLTPLTSAGIQEHWNFNTRSVVSGPPTRSPTVPATLSEMRSYVESPSAWNFYP